MASRLEKLRAELSRAKQRLTECEEKVRELEQKCLEEENTEIHNMVRAANMTPEMLARLLSMNPQDRISTLKESEDKKYEK